MGDVRVGVGTLIFKDGFVFLSKRMGSHGEGTWGSTGGHLEFGESLEQCAKREAWEEFGISLRKIQFLCLSNIVEYGTHYVDVEFITILDKEQIPVIQESEKFETWGWFDIDDLPEPLFKPIEYAIKAYISGTVYMDNG